jgi:hypothetical protein
LAGERKPKHANNIKKTVDAASCTPVPIITHSQEARGGARKTSPWTSFQPVSSCPSSSDS